MKTALLSLIIAVCIALFSLFQFDKYQKFFLDTHTQTLDTHAQLIKLDTQVQEKLNNFHIELNTLSNEQQKLLHQTQSTTWRLAEAEYWVRLAAERLQILGDVKTATTLVSTALDKIQKLNDPHLATLEKNLQSDLAALQQVPLLNTTELWLQTSTLIEQIPQMPLRGYPSSDASTESVNTTSTSARSTSKDSFNWKQALLHSWEQIKELVKIRHHTKPIEPLLSTSEQALVKENFRLMLEQLRSSILNTNMKIYIQLIQESEQWLNQYFDEKNSHVIQAKNTLQVLSTIHLQPELPTLTQTLTQFDLLRQ